MKYRALFLITPFILIACASESTFDPLADYEQVDPATILDAPKPLVGDVLPENRDIVARGEYLVELLGCGTCHTDGALIGEPNAERSLAGSRIGIAYANPLQNSRPGVIYPPNITPDDETGIGLWSDEQIAEAVRAGLGRHGSRRIVVMPWQAYAKISNDDAYAIVGYLRNIEAVKHRVPDDVPPGTRAQEPFVHFGVYRSR